MPSKTIVHNITQYLLGRNNIIKHNDIGYIKLY